MALARTEIQYLSPWRTHLTKVCTYLIVIGLTAAFVADLIKAQELANSATLESGYNLYTEDFVLPFTWKIATIIGLIGILGSSFLTFFVEDIHKVGRLTWVAFIVMQCWMSSHAVIAFFNGFTPFEIISFKGPAVWWSCAAVFVGLNRERWKILSPLIYMFSFVACFFALKAIFSNQFASRIESLRALFGYMPIMLWTAPLLLIMIFQKSKLKMLAGCIPYLTLLLCSFLVVTRSWLLLSLLILPAVWFVAKRSTDKSFFRSWLLLFPSIIILVLVIVGWNYFESQISTAYDLLQNRLYEDTRSGQYIEFFSQVPITDLIVGRGPKGTWIWAGKEYTSIDGSYFLMLFNGGLPLLCSYVIIMIRPAITVMKMNAPAIEMLSAVILCVWAIALTGVSIYSVPDITLSHIILCLYAGRCFGYLHEMMVS